MKTKKICYSIAIYFIITSSFIYGAPQSIESSENCKKWTTIKERDVPFVSEILRFRDALYNQEINNETIRNYYYNSSMKAAKKISSSYDQLVQLSRCEYYRGRSYLLQLDLSSAIPSNEDIEKGKTASDTSVKAEVKALAGRCFDKGISYAKKALKEKKGSDAYLILSQNISFNCLSKNFFYLLFNGLSVVNYAKQATSIDNQNAQAYFIQNAQDLFAPVPFGCPEKGSIRIQEILEKDKKYFERDDYYNYYYGIAYAYFRAKNYNQSTQWLIKSLTIYPSNHDSLLLLEKIKKENATLQ